MAPEQRQSSGTMVARPRVLTNSCAEFVEVRAGQAIIERISDVTQEVSSPEFISAIDGFVPQNEAPDLSEAASYRPSAEKLAEFEAILKRFSQLLEKRKVFRRLGIQPRDPSQYTLDYVLSIARLVKEDKETTENSQVCKKFMRKCFRAASNHKSVITGLINCAPNDIYGSVLAGAFAMILTAANEHENLRKEIYAALADIPKKLNNIQRLSEVHIYSTEYHECVSTLFISIFGVLEKIIDKLTMGFADKLSAKVKGRSDDVRKALEKMEENVTELQQEIDICTQLRMGRIEENGKSVKVVADSIKAAVDGLETKLDDFKTVQESTKMVLKQISDNQTKLLGEAQQASPQLEAGVYNLLYRFLASNPAFNPVDGTVNKQDAKQNRAANQKAIGASSGGSVVFSVDRNRELVDSWLKRLGDFDPTSETHVAKCIARISDLSLDEADKVQWIMDSKVFGEWLSLTESCLLSITAETAPQSLTNPLTTTTALLAATLKSATKFPVLSFFCGLRKMSSRDEAQSGTLGVLKSLNGQLLASIVDDRPTVDLSFLESGDDKKAARSQERLKSAFALLKSQLAVLPEFDVVFILIDSFSRLAGDKAKGDALVEKLVALIDEMPHLVIKILVTDCLPTSRVRRLAHRSLYVPDEVDGHRSGINVRSLEKSNFLRVQEFRSRQEARSSAEESSDSDDDGW